MSLVIEAVTAGSTPAAGYFIEIVGVSPMGFVEASRMVATGLECGAVCMSVGCQVYTLTTTSKGRLCTALSNVYRLHYIPLDPTVRIYTTEERLSALTTTTSSTTTSTTTPLPPCLNIPVANTDLTREDAPNSLTVDQSNYYVLNTEYSWRIIVQPGFRVQLTWTSFDVEQGYDFVSVSDPCTADGSYAWTQYTGTALPPVTTSSRNEILILFTSDVMELKAGFTVHYAAV
ncbi:CUB and sushi domain-containing protein 2-like [Penaeus vannamei]|uniref:CUB and sushi domain-containing protein 2-like n=1 Tax=Penaeus vannamei TaxID=6689 RepID=UPI00387FA048